MSYKLALVWVMLLMLSACSTIETHVDYDSSANFAAFKTYMWLDDSTKRYADAALNSDILKARIHNTIDAALAAKGFQKVTENPTFLIGYHLALKDKTNITTLNNYYGYNDGWGYRYNNYGANQTLVYEYVQGSLLVDFVYPDSKKLFWRGSAQAEVNQKHTKKENDELVATAVKKMLENFPPKK